MSFSKEEMLALRQHVRKLFGEEVVELMDEISENPESHGLTGKEDCLVLLNQALKELGKPHVSYEDLINDLKDDPRIKKFQAATTSCIQAIRQDAKKHSHLAKRLVEELKQNALASNWMQAGYETFVTDDGYDLPQEAYEAIIGAGALLGMLVAKKLRLYGDLERLSKVDRDGGAIVGPTSQITLMALESLKKENVDESDIKLLEAIAKVSALYLSSGEELAMYAQIVESSAEQFAGDKNFQAKLVQSAVLAGVAVGWRMREIAELVEKGALKEEVPDGADSSVHSSEVVSG